MEVQLHKDRFTLSVSSPSFFSCHPFMSPFHPFFRGGIPEQRGYSSQASRQTKTRTNPHWPRETGNLRAPASGSEIKAVIETSQKRCCCLTSCTCDRLATSTFPVSDTRKRLLWLCKRVFSHSQIMLALLLTISNPRMNTLSEQRWSWGSLLPYTKEYRWDGEALTCSNILCGSNYYQMKQERGHLETTHSWS